MNMFVSTAAVAAVPTAAPAITPPNVDGTLISLGQQFDDMARRVNETGKRADELYEPIRSAIEAQASWPVDQNQWSRDDAQRYLETKRRIEKEIGAEWGAAEDLHEDAYGPCDDITRAIWAVPAQGPAGLAVKAKVAAFANIQLWDEPFDDLDWGPKSTVSLIEATFAAASLPTPAEYLGSSGIGIDWPHPDAALFAAIARYYLACREWGLRLSAFDEVDLLKPRPRGWKSKQSASVKAAFAAQNAEQAVIAIPATTVDGLIAKARAGKNEWYESAGLLISVGEDLIGMKPGREVIPSTTTRNRSDAEIIELGREFERLLALEKPLEEKSSKLHALTDRLQCQKVGLEPDDGAAWQKAIRARHSECMQAWTDAAKETGYGAAATAWNRASAATGRIGRKILKLKATTPEGLLVRARVIETHDEILGMGPTEQLLAEIKEFARVSKAA